MRRELTPDDAVHPPSDAVASEEEEKRIGGAAFLVQGTSHPDVIESVSVNGSQAVIKTHYNAVGCRIPDSSSRSIDAGAILG